MVSLNRFSALTEDIRKAFEGGYYHPDMMTDGRMRYDARYLSSGETHLGIDRKNGAGALRGNPGWGEFWAIIDNAGARKKWKWNYLGGQYENQLRALAVKIMYPHFVRLFNKYLTEKARNIVLSDPRLTMHFAYAAWNGEGWFERFADKFNAQIQTITDKNKLAAYVLNNRTGSTNSLIRQSGEKMVKLFAGMANGAAGSILPIALVLLFF